MEKLYYTLAEATAYLKTDAVNLGERGLLAMAYRWPESIDTLNTGYVIESHIKPGWEPVDFGYVTLADFRRVVNAERMKDKAILRNTFATLEELGRAAEIIDRRNQGVHLITSKLLKHGVKANFLYAGLDDMYVTAEAMAAYDATPAGKVEDEEKEGEEIYTREDGEPILRKGKNDRAKVDAWVKWRAAKEVKINDNMNDLATRIKLSAERWGYQSERGPLSISSIVKIIPAGITGGRAKNMGKPKK